MSNEHKPIKPNEATLMDVQAAFGKLEPGLPPVPIEQSLLSIAISMKRCADALDRIANDVNTQTTSGYGPQLIDAVKGLSSTINSKPSLGPELSRIAGEVAGVGKAITDTSAAAATVKTGL